MLPSTRSHKILCVLSGVIIGILMAGVYISPKKDSSVSIAILPHHGITGDHIEDFYSKLKNRQPNFDTIIIISPDHFGLTTQSVESLPNRYQTMCYQDTCIRAESFVGYESKNTKKLFDKNGSTIEHGLGEHITRIARYFPESTTVPIVVKRENIVTTLGENIAHDILRQNKYKNVLIVVSVDFSHHVREPFAQLHDQKSINTLSWGTRKDFSKLEVDCRNCLFIGQEIARKVGKRYFSLWDRTSVDSITHQSADTQNTSHIFGMFEREKTSSPEAVFLFGGDTHWARDFQKYSEKYPGGFEKIMRIFYQEYDTKKTPPTWYHTILRGFDEVVVNFESAIAPSEECEKNGKNIQLITHEKDIKKFADIGVTLVSIANNHTRDCGESIFQKLYQIFPKYNIGVIGKEQDVIREINNQQYVFMSLNTIETPYDFEDFLKRIKKYQQKNTMVIVNIHWGQEYEKKHSQKQEDMAHAIVDAGARLIIGHHPHVVQDEEIYNGVPIYYSLGNFVFDQVFPETLEGWFAGCSISREKTLCQKIPFYRWEKDYTLNWFPEKKKN